MTEPVDPAAVLMALGWEATAPPRPVTGGLATSVWRFATSSGAEHALRLFRPGEQATAAREQVAMQAARAARLPVPLVDAAGQWQDRPALIMRWAAGAPLAGVVARQPWRLWRLGVRFGRLQARLHQVPAPAALAADQATFLHTIGSRSGRSLPPQSGSPALLHMDFHPLNILSDGRRLTAILDWATASAGDRRLDLARTQAILLGAPLPPGLPPALMNPARVVLAAAWRRGYAALAGDAAVRDLEALTAVMGEVLLEELTPRAADPATWVTDADIERLRRWVAGRRRG